MIALLGSSWIAACVDRTDPRTIFLDQWLDDHALGWTPSSRSDLVTVLLDSEKQTGIDAFMLLAVIEEESRYAASARSHKGARGLMQLRPTTARSVAARLGVVWSGPQDLDDTEKNVRLGAAYLADLKKEFGKWETALSAYHTGPTRIRRIKRRGGTLPSAYAARVLQRFRRIHQAYDTGRDH